MVYFRSSLFIMTLSLLTTLSGCGDLFQKKVKDQKLESDKFRANCELNIDEFSLIMEEPIEDAINCLGENLRLFVRAVESKRPGYMSRTSLEAYIKRYRQDIGPEVVKALKAVFDINFLVYGEDPDFISRANIDALISFALMFNEKAALNFKPIFMDEDSLEYDYYRILRDQKIAPAARLISSGLRNIFNQNRNGKIHKLNIVKVLEAFTTESNRASMDKVKKVLFAKKIILGGEKEVITHVELDRLIQNLDSFILIALDAVRYKDIRHDQESMVHFLNTDVEELQRLIFSTGARSGDDEVLFTIREAVDTAKLFMSKDSDLDLEKFFDLIKEAKTIIMDGSLSEVTSGDLKRLFAHGLDVLKTGSLFHRFWKTERILLEALPRRPITYNFKNLYDLFPKEKSRVEDFVRIVKMYRFQKGENLSAFYTDDYYRNANGVFEIAMFEYALKLVFKKYGSPNVKPQMDQWPEHKDSLLRLREMAMDKGQVVNLMNKFSKVLIETDLIYPGREEKTAETITLLGSLFQYQSDDNKVFDVNEATEFAISLFTSIEISEELENHYRKAEVNCPLDPFGRVEPNCFKQHFFRGVCLNYPDHFPKLFSSLGATVYEDKKLVCRIPENAPNMAYLETAIKAARTCNVYPDTQEEIYYSKGDMMTIFLAMMHIETTIIRWDTRTLNNIMDPAEVMDAYNIYSPALDGFLEEMPGIVKSLKKQIYQYLVKYEKVPNEKEFSSIWKFLKFLLSFKKDAPANRKTIASILVTISEQGAPSTFDCKLLRNPDEIKNAPTVEYAPMAVSVPGPLMTRLSSSDLSVAAAIESTEDGKIISELEITHPGIFRFRP